MDGVVAGGVVWMNGDHVIAALRSRADECLANSKAPRGEIVEVACEYAAQELTGRADALQVAVMAHLEAEASSPKTSRESLMEALFQVESRDDGEWAWAEELAREVRRSIELTRPEGAECWNCKAELGSYCQACGAKQPG